MLPIRLLLDCSTPSLCYSSTFHLLTPLLAHSSTSILLHSRLLLVYVSTLLPFFSAALLLHSPALLLFYFSACAFLHPLLLLLHSNTLYAAIRQPIRQQPIFVSGYTPLYADIRRYTPGLYAAYTPNFILKTKCTFKVICSDLRQIKELKR